MDAKQIRSLEPAAIIVGRSSPANAAWFIYLPEPDANGTRGVFVLADSVTLDHGDACFWRGEFIELIFSAGEWATITRMD